MPSIIFRKYRAPDKVELNFDDVEILSVQEVRKKVSSTMGIPLEELKLVYGGRVLKAGKKLTDYSVVAGCTIFVMTSKPKKSPMERLRAGPDRLGLLGNRRVLAMMGRVLSNPVVLQDIMQGTSLGENSAMLNVLRNPELVANLTDPDNIQEYIRENPPVAAMMEHLIQQFLGSGVEGVEDVEDEEQLVDLLEGHLEEEMAQVEREGEVQLAMAQEQMFEHSQALHAHHQQQQQQQQQQEEDHQPSQPSSLSATASPLPSQQDSSYDPSSSQQHGSLVRQNSGSASGITRELLATALATAMETTPIIPVSPQPTLLREQLATALATAMEATPMVPVTPQPSPLSSLDMQVGSIISLSPEQPPPPYSSPLPSTHTSHMAERRRSGPVPRPGPISPATLQQALAEVVRSTRTGSRTGRTESRGIRMDTESSRSDSTSSRTSRTRNSSRHPRMPEDDREVLAQRYREQLNQLHLMGIRDDAACLQALIATEGDLQAALEILYSK